MKLDQLPQVAEETLGGLKADASLYMKIRQRAQAPARSLPSPCGGPLRWPARSYW